MFPVGDEDACKAYLTARRWPKASTARVAATRASMTCRRASGIGSATQCAPDTSGYRFSVHCRHDLREHEQAAARLVPGRPFDADQQEGHERPANQPLHGLRLATRPLGYMCHKIRAALVEKTSTSLAASSRLTKPSSAAKTRTTIGTSATAARRHRLRQDADHRRGQPQGQRRRSRPRATSPRDTARSFVREVVSTKVSLLATDE